LYHYAGKIQKYFSNKAKRNWRHSPGGTGIVRIEKEFSRFENKLDGSQ
jgi:hypothetical protein